jgi:hypothetical protein
MKHYTPTGWVDDGAESIKGWGTEDDYKEVLERLDTTPEMFLSHVVYSLTWDLKEAAANITGIYCDQWCGVAASGAPFETEGMLATTGDDGKISTWIECQAVEWGVAATWKIFADRFGLRKDGSDG